MPGGANIDELSAVDISRNALLWPALGPTAISPHATFRGASPGAGALRAPITPRWHCDREGERKGLNMQITSFKDLYITELQELMSLEGQLIEA
jgi:hypothetical protein